MWLVPLWSIQLAIFGLAGVGKTQVALELAYWAQKNKPAYSIFCSYNSSSSPDFKCTNLSNIFLWTLDEQLECGIHGGLNNIVVTMRLLLPSGKKNPLLTTAFCRVPQDNHMIVMTFSLHTDNQPLQMILPRPTL